MILSHGLEINFVHRLWKFENWPFLFKTIHTWGQLTSPKVPEGGISKIAPHLPRFPATLQTGSISPESYQAERIVSFSYLY